MPGRYQVGVYYFPNYHMDPRNEAVHGPGWTEWELVKRAEPKFAEHRQPKVPLWGYEDEADPAVFAKKTAAAAEHGIDHFIFDWYWYDDGPFLNRCLDEGYLKAANNARVEFGLMWANHDWLDIHPAKAHEPARLLYAGKVTREALRTMMDRVIERYFAHPSYWKIDGCPYFSVYMLGDLIASCGDAAQTREALEEFRAKAKRAGFPGLHLNAIVWGRPILPGETAPTDSGVLLDRLGFDSFTSYVWVHHVALPGSPTTEYQYVRDRYLEYWEKTKREANLPYFPNVTMGWDSTPRTVQSDKFQLLGYPFSSVIANNTPQAFKEALTITKQRLDESDGPGILNINAWNEWTEGSYLEPDRANGMGYLEAIRDVFGRR